ncbi:MAG: hypothetical protein QXW71_04415, partial [Thermoplasmata archaeon]
MEKISVAIIGGSGIGEIFEVENEINIHTPYGLPSDNISIGKISGVKVAFLPRHGKGHKIPPHKINYRANIYSLKEIGVKKIIGVSAVGSLRENLKPGDLAIVSQFIDFTKKRDKSTIFIHNAKYDMSLLRISMFADMIEDAS